MARFQVRPVICQTAPQSWSYSLVLSNPIYHLDPSHTPVWIINIVLSGDQAAELGPILIEDLNSTYEKLELKTPEALYQSLKQFTDQHDQIDSSFGAMCFTSALATIIGIGRFRVEVWRQERQAIVLTGADNVWHVVEGKWLATDKWCIVAGEPNKIDTLQLLSEPDSEIAVEQLQAKILNSEPLMVAATLITQQTETQTENDEQVAFDDGEEKIVRPDVINKRRVMALGLIILLLLIVSVWYGSKTRVEKQLATSFSGLEAEVNQQIAVATSLQSVDQVKARQTVREIQDKVTASKSNFEKNPSWTAKWNALNTRVTTMYQQLAGEAVVSDLPEWFALSVIKSGFVGDQLIVAGDNLVVLDKASNTLVKLGITSKRADIMAGGDVQKNMQNLAVEGSRAIVTSDAGVEEISLTRKTTTTLIAKDASWQQVGGLALFNGNVYLLDAAEIWRYPAITAGVGQKQRWLGAGTTAPQGTTGGLQVDGDLWLLQTNGIIKRFRRGAPLNFALSGLDTPLTTTTALTVSLDQDLIAVLDQGNQRVVAFDKQGVYKKQFKWAGLTDAKSIGMSSDAKILYILKGGSIYTANW